MGMGTDPWGSALPPCLGVIPWGWTSTQRLGNTSRGCSLILRTRHCPMEWTSPMGSGINPQGQALLHGAGHHPTKVNIAPWGQELTPSGWASPHGARYHPTGMGMTGKGGH